MKVFHKYTRKMSCYYQQKYLIPTCNTSQNHFNEIINQLNVKYWRNIIINIQWKYDPIEAVRFCYSFVTKSISNKLKSLISLNLSFSFISIWRNKESVNSWPYDIFIYVGLCNCVFVYLCMCAFVCLGECEFIYVRSE